MGLQYVLCILEGPYPLGRCWSAWRITGYSEAELLYGLDGAPADRQSVEEGPCSQQIWHIGGTQLLGPAHDFRIARHLT
jgi:hypothetical protein